MSDAFARLASAYRVRANAGPSAKLDMLMDIEEVRDPRVVPFLLSVLKDGDEVEEVRVYVVRELRIRKGLVGASERQAAAAAIADVLATESSVDLRLQACLGLGAFAEVPGVLAQLGNVCLAEDESIDLRYTAFTSLQRAGPTPECVMLLRQIALSETLGGSARSVLSAWHVA